MTSPPTGGTPEWLTAAVGILSAAGGWVLAALGAAPKALALRRSARRDDIRVLSSALGRLGQQLEREMARADRLRAQLDAVQVELDAMEQQESRCRRAVGELRSRVQALEAEARESEA